MYAYTHACVPYLHIECRDTPRRELRQTTGVFLLAGKISQAPGARVCCTGRPSLMWTSARPAAYGRRTFKRRSLPPPTTRRRWCRRTRSSPVSTRSDKKANKGGHTQGGRRGLHKSTGRVRASSRFRTRGTTRPLERLPAQDRSGSIRLSEFAAPLLVPRLAANMPMLSELWAVMAGTAEADAISEASLGAVGGHMGVEAAEVRSMLLEVGDTKTAAVRRADFMGLFGVAP